MRKESLAAPTRDEKKGHGVPTRRRGSWAPGAQRREMREALFAPFALARFAFVVVVAFRRKLRVCTPMHLCTLRVQSSDFRRAHLCTGTACD